MGPDGDDVIGDLYGAGPRGMASDPALANKEQNIDDQDLADAGTAVVQMRQGELPIDGGTTAEIWGGTRGQSAGSNEGRDYGDEDPRELESA